MPNVVNYPVVSDSTKRKYGVVNSEQRRESTPIRRKKEKNEPQVASPITPVRQFNFVSPGLSKLRRTRSQQFSPVTPGRQSIHTSPRVLISPKALNSPRVLKSPRVLNSPKVLNSPFTSARSVLDLEPLSLSIPKRVLTKSLSQNDYYDYFKLNDSDLNNFDPDKAQVQNYMSDDSAFENFDLEEVVSEVNKANSSKFDDSFPEELLIDRINEVERSNFIREKIENLNRKHDSISKSFVYSANDSNSWEVSVIVENTDKADSSSQNDLIKMETDFVSEKLEKSSALSKNDAKSPDIKEPDKVTKLDSCSHGGKAKVKTEPQQKTTAKNLDHKHKVHNSTFVLSQDDANSWGISPSAEPDSGLGSSFDSKNNSSICDKNASKLVLQTNKPTPKGITCELMFNKHLRAEVLAGKVKTTPKPKPEITYELVEEESFFGLPYIVKLLISKYKGITDLYPWQKECLNLEAISKRKNLIYALPTSGGKTLVAEILILKEILCKEKNVIFILPYVSIVQEKVRSLAPFGLELKFLVEEYAGGKGIFPPVQRRRKRTVYIATIEKASGLVNSLFETGRLDEIGLICIDELHLIGESRGAVLESTLTKIMFKNVGIQVIAMSATIGNIPQLAHFLNAETYSKDFRPVELTEFVKCGNSVFSVTNGDEGKQLVPTRNVKLQPNDPDYIAGLVGEVIPGDSCLVFCASKKNCENVALLVCKALDESLKEPRNNERKALLRALAAEGNGAVCKILRQTIPFGIAYHHSGLTVAERKLLEEAFCANTICCICCTSTLAAGVNLPAKRVIIRSPYVGRDFITFSQYKQMIGRAGRAGFGVEGESYLLCQQSDCKKVMVLINSKVNSCDSQLQNTDSFPALILSAIGLNLANTSDKLNELLDYTLFHAQNSFDVELSNILNETLNHLLEVEALQTKLDEGTTKYELTSLGKAAMKGNISIADAKKLRANLKTALKAVSLSNYLHRLYLITPYTMFDQIPINREVYFNVFMALNEEELNVARIIGIDDGSIMKFMSGKKFKEEQSIMMHRFYLTLILHSLWEGRNVWQVASMFNISRGLVHSFLTSAASFNSSVIRFCEEIKEFSCVAVLLKEMSERLIHCCSAELLPLMELPSVKLGRAKQLMNAGFKTLQIIACSDVNTMVSKIDHLPKRVACQIIAAAKLLLLAKAELLQEEAAQVLEGLEGLQLA